MKFYLYRTSTRPLSTDGVLCDEHGSPICNTAEHTLHKLPEGTYQLSLQRHHRLGHRALLLQRHHRLGRRTLLLQRHHTPTAMAWIIHGNGVYGKAFGASIVVGEYLVPGVVVRSYPYFERLLKRIEKVIKRGSQVELIIQSS